MANAMVIGIGGVGSVIGQKLHEFECFDRIVLADIERVFAEQLASRMPRHRFVVVQVNAMDTERLASLIKEHKVEVTCNACNCQTNHSVLEACFKGGSHYLDMAADIYSPPGIKRPDKNSFEAEIEKFNGATVDGYSCVGTEVRGTKDRRRVEYFVYTMDSHRDTYERYGYSLTLVQTGIPPALTARLLSPERFASAES